MVYIENDKFPINMNYYNMTRTGMLTWLVLTFAAIFGHSASYAQDQAMSVAGSDTLYLTDIYWTPVKWERKAVETLRLNEDSSFSWNLHSQTTPLDITIDENGQGSYSIAGDTIVLNSDRINTMEINCLKTKKYNKDKRKIEIKSGLKGNIVRQALFVLYINEKGDTVFANNLYHPDSWSMQSTPRSKKLELEHPKEIIDIFVDNPFTLHPTEKQLQTINQHKGDIELICNFAETGPGRIFDSEKWIINGDTIYPLTEDGYSSVYPLVKNDSVYISTREYYGKPYGGEFYGPKTTDGDHIDFDSDRSRVHYNTKYYKQANANGFKTLGIITKEKCYDKDGKLVAEGEYLSDTYNPFLRWYKYIKVGRWKYYEPDGTVRYVDY